MNTSPERPHTSLQSLFLRRENKVAGNQCESVHRHTSLSSQVCYGLVLCTYTPDLWPQSSQKPHPYSPLQEVKIRAARPGLSPPARRGVWSLWHDSQHGKSAALSLLLKHSSHNLFCSALQRETIEPSSTPIWSCRFTQKVAGRQLQSFFGGGPGRCTHTHTHTHTHWRRRRERGEEGEGDSRGGAALSSLEGGHYQAMFTAAQRTLMCAAVLTFGI